MADNITYKILKEHLIKGELVKGKEIGIRIDQTLTQDATGTMAYLQFESMGIDRVKTDVSVSYVDHNTLQEGFENADDHRYLQSVAEKYGIFFSRPGNGICHQVHLERFGDPGRTLLGSDSHTPTGGGIGMLAVGAGGLDVAVAMGGGPFYMICPEVIKIELTGRLRPWVSAKDVILHILGILSTKGNVNKVIEYAGEGVKTLSVPERATITNMGAETGVTTSIFPSDEVTRQFLRAQDREEQWYRLEADKKAEYDRVISIDLSEVIPMVAKPHSPGNVCPVMEIAGMKVDQVAIGSCTNSSLRDLKIVGKLLEGKKVADGVSLVIAPGSKQVFSMISEDGTLSTMIDSGARIMESTCGFCIGNGQAPGTEAVSLRTNNRNFEGRCGTPSAGVYLVSPETAVISAIEGRITDPMDKLGGKMDPAVELPERFRVQDNMIIPPAEPGQEAVIKRGPNIGPPPVNEQFKDTLRGEVGIKVGDKITTDHIMPAGPRLKYRSNIKKYSEFVFEGIDKEFPPRALSLKDKDRAVFIVAGESYGQGSSREHAALCPMYLGVKAVMARSFERIHASNLVNFGILPLVFGDREDYNNIAAGDELSLRNIKMALSEGDTLTVSNETRNKEIKFRLELSGRQREIILAGGLLNHTRQTLS